MIEVFPWGSISRAPTTAGVPGADSAERLGGFEKLPCRGCTYDLLRNPAPKIAE